MVPKYILVVICIAQCFLAPASRADPSRDRNYQLGNRVFLKVLEISHSCHGEPHGARGDRQCRLDIQFENDNDYNVHVRLRIRTHDRGGRIREATPEYWLKSGYLYCSDDIRTPMAIEVTALLVEQTAKDPDRQTACPHVSLSSNHPPAR